MVASVAATLAEEQDARHQRHNGSGDSNEEAPVEHHSSLVEASIVVLVHESCVDANSNTDANRCKAHQQLRIYQIPTIRQVFFFESFSHFRDFSVSC